MLKKAGIIVAAATASVLAFAPLAFAGDATNGDSNGNHHSKSDGDHHHKSDDKDKDKKSGDGDSDEGNLKNDCRFGNEGGSPTASALGGSSVLGAVGLVTSAATDVTSQLNTLNCNNINVTDLVDSDSNNRTSSEESTEVDGSFNQDN